MFIQSLEGGWLLGLLLVTTGYSDLTRADNSALPVVGGRTISQTVNTGGVGIIISAWVPYTGCILRDEEAGDLDEQH